MMRILPGAWLLLAAGTAQAQPPEPDIITPFPQQVPVPQQVPAKIARPNAPATYLETDARAFVDAVARGNAYNAARHVFGARQGFFGASEWEKWWQAQITSRAQTAPVEGELAPPQPKPILELLSLAPELVDEKSATAKLKFSYHGGEREETLAFRWEQTARNIPEDVEARWQIVPQALASTESSWSNPLRFAAYMTAQQPGALDAIRAMQTQTNLKQVGLGAMQLAQDYDERFAFAPELWSEAIQPYVQSKSIFLVPGTQTLYAFNPFLSDVNLANIADAANTVMFYDGELEQFNFRHDGRAAVCFADGHVELVDAARARTVKWKPTN